MGNASVTEKKLVSVLMPVRNGEQYLAKALGSILNQTYRDLEVIIFNDGSTDATGDIIHSFHDARIRLFDRTCHGITKSLNFGLKQCQGDFVARMDADDICYPERIERQLQTLSERRADLVWCNALLIDDEGDYICHRYQPTEFWTLKLLGRTNFILHPGVLFRKATVDSVGGYDDAFPYGQDARLWKTLMARNATLALCDEFLMDYRVSTKAVSYKNFGMPLNLEHRNALVCLKNRAGRRFFHYFKNVHGARSRVYLLTRYLVGETLILYLRLALEAMKLRGNNRAVISQPDMLKDPGYENAEVRTSGELVKDKNRHNQIPMN